MNKLIIGVLQILSMTNWGQEPLSKHKYFMSEN
jgi:hypothetical protein